MTRAGLQEARRRVLWLRTPWVPYRLAGTLAAVLWRRLRVVLVWLPGWPSVMIRPSLLAAEDRGQGRDKAGIYQGVVIH